jgi:hypothetical protein
VLVIAGILRGIFPPFSIFSRAQATIFREGNTPDYIKGPFTDITIRPTVFNGDLRQLPQHQVSGTSEPEPIGEAEVENQANRPSISPKEDPIAQRYFAQGQMPQPILNFDGLNVEDGGGWYPPDTNGDVGPNHYIQTVKIALGIFDKATGAELVNMTFNDFFQGPPGSACDDDNRGDVIALYDPQVDRWLITDFAQPGPDYYECIAVSQSGDPVSGGWYFYEIRASTGQYSNYWNDYPKLGVWSDGWYMSANMFTHKGNEFGGVRLWALDREDALHGNPIHMIYFDCGNLTYCASLLPANVRGPLPPAGSAEYFANILQPDNVNLWHFHTNWEVPEASRLTGPVTIKVAEFSTFSEVPQKDSITWKLDSLSDRMMFQLQYRNLAGTDVLYATHSVRSDDVSGIRWYEIHDPGGNPYVYQQSTYQPDDYYRWMGSIAADQDGNIAVGYSISDFDMFPSIRYAGRLAGETPNILTQNETSLIEGTGSQIGSNRWGDYSAMTVDPVDDCTFWYTSEYLKTSGDHWDTRIGSFKFPSCGAPKGKIEGYLYDPSTSLPWAGASVVASSSVYTYTTVTDQNGFYSMPLGAGSYTVTAGPFLPGYGNLDTVNNVAVTPPHITPLDFQFVP